VSASVPEAPSSVRLGRADGRWVLTATVLGSSMALLDATVVNIALPTIGKELHASLAGLQWTVTAYTLALAGLILLGGALGDRHGRRKVFMIGVIWFALASALCGLSPDIGVLIGARVLQGIGGALLTPGSLAIIQASFAPGDRPKAVGAWSGLGGVAGAAGPLLGGWIVADAGWRWVFLLNLPLAAIVLAVTSKHVPESADPDAHGGFDITGAVLAALALAGITYALIEAPAGSGPLGPILAGVAGAAAVAGFILTERRRGRPGSRTSPMLPLGVFSSRQFTAVNVVTLVVYAALSGMLFLLVLQLQLVVGFSPLAAGSALLPMTLIMLSLSARAGALAQRIGPRWLMAGGTATAGAGILLLVRVGPHSHYLTDVLPAVVVFGLGLSMTVAPLTATVLASADVRHAGVASGVNNMVARAAGLIAVAGLPAVVGLTSADYHSSSSFNSSFHLAMIVCGGLLLAGAVLSALTIDDHVLSQPEDEVPAPTPECLRNCGIGAPPLQASERAPVPVAAAGPDPGPPAPHSG
jgi:EmrB/QacA subfamily drug resistance transporter